MISRYTGRDIVINANDLYSNLFDERGVQFIRQYLSPNFRKIEEKDLYNIQMIGHIWKLGDKYYKLAHKYYKNSKYWWIIAWFNKKPTESHVANGDTLIIPLPLENILTILGV